MSNFKLVTKWFCGLCRYIDICCPIYFYALPIIFVLTTHFHQKQIHLDICQTTFHQKQTHLDICGRPLLFYNTLYYTFLYNYVSNIRPFIDWFMPLQRQYHYYYDIIRAAVARWPWGGRGAACGPPRWCPCPAAAWRSAPSSGGGSCRSGGYSVQGQGQGQVQGQGQGQVQGQGQRRSARPAGGRSTQSLIEEPTLASWWGWSWFR